MTKWTKIEDYMDGLRERMAAEQNMMAEIVSRNCQFPDCISFEDNVCRFGCPFESDKQK